MFQQNLLMRSRIINSHLVTFDQNTFHININQTRFTSFGAMMIQKGIQIHSLNYITSFFSRGLKI